MKWYLVVIGIQTLCLIIEFIAMLIAQKRERKAFTDLATVKEWCKEMENNFIERQVLNSEQLKEKQILIDNLELENQKHINKAIDLRNDIHTLEVANLELKKQIDVLKAVQPDIVQAILNVIKRLK